MCAEGLAGTRIMMSVCSGVYHLPITTSCGWELPFSAKKAGLFTETNTGLAGPLGLVIVMNGCFVVIQTDRDASVDSAYGRG